MISPSNLASPGGSMHLMVAPMAPEEPWDERGLDSSSQWAAGSTMSQTPPPGVCHRLHST